MDEVVTGVLDHLDEAADLARPSRAERATLRGHEVLNPYIFYDTS